MKEITVYELLGLIKDGKAPKKFIKDNTLYYYDEENKFYRYDSGSYIFKGFYFNELNKKILVVEF